MLDQIDLNLALSKREYRQALPELQARLFDMEQAVLEAGVPVLIVFEGWAGTAKVRTISVLSSRLDPRGLRVYPITPPRTSEQQYPWLYRFWLKLPAYGEIAVFDRSWYREMLAERVRGGDAARWRQRCEDVVTMERQLTDDGAEIVKLWLHISKKEQRRRFERLTANPLTAYQVTDEDRWQHRHYEEYAAAVEDMLARTNTPAAPWHVIPANNKYYARVAMFQAVIATLEARLGRRAVPVARSAYSQDPDLASGAYRERNHLSLREPPPDLSLSYNSVSIRQPLPAILKQVDLSLRMDEKRYARELKQLQARLHLLGLQLYQQKRPAVIVFEGWDAAGKGGTIQRLTAELDPRSYTVHAIAAPTGEDKVRHYLYRFWRRLPPRGQFAIFDRSWYGRVLVERVEGFASPNEWRRAYVEINEFERQLIDSGTIICKFWMHISPEEQLRRFEARRNVPYKAWKLTAEDWRNREKWALYEEAADEMLLRTSTPAAPWTIVEAEDKHYARIKVLRTVVQRLESELGKIKF